MSGSQKAMPGTYLLAAVVATAVAAMALVGPIAQDPKYHIFADTREFLAIPNFWNVMSNLPFVAAGIEHVSAQRARQLLLPLLIAGTASVLYWAVTEAGGNGDLRPYALVQFLPMILIPLILFIYRSPFDLTAFIWLAVVMYAASKPLEYCDRRVFELSGMISGHSLKHVVAAVVPLVLLYGFSKRRPVIGIRQTA